MERHRKNEMSRRGFLRRGSGALAAAGWTAVAGGWVLRPNWAHAAGPSIKIGIATDITGILTASGNACWQTAQFVAKEINDRGGILDRPIELVLADTASDPGLAVGNVRRLVEEADVDIVIGGNSSAMREAIKNPIVRRGKKPYIYPQLYEGQECTEHVFCTGPTPAQQTAPLIRHLIEQGNKRFAMVGANYIWPQRLNVFARQVIEENGGEIVFEEYFPIDQLEYSASVSRLMNEGVDHIFNTTIPPGLQGFNRQLYDAGFTEKGGTISCVYLDETGENYLPPRELAGYYSCLDFYQSLEDEKSQQLLASYSEMFPDTPYLFTSGSTAAGTYRSIKLFEQAVIATDGDLGLDAISGALNTAEIAEGPGGPARMVPGTGHVAMNMYIARCGEDGKKWNILSKNEMSDPLECA